MLANERENLCLQYNITFLVLKGFQQQAAKVKTQVKFYVHLLGVNPTKKHTESTLHPMAQHDAMCICIAEGIPWPHKG